MKPTLASTLLTAVIAVAATPVFADDAIDREVKQVFDLKDGGTLYVFKDGKMAKEDQYGRAVALRIGEALEAKNGQEIRATSSEPSRLDTLLKRGHEG